jgi:GT2 family glycosyltransferase
VDVIIPTYNGWHLLERCLASLAESTFTDYSLTIFDDRSTEQIEMLVHGLRPDARVIRSDENVGLARGCNIAIAATSSEYVALLNNDTEVEPGWLAALVACADSHPRSGSIASKMLLASDRTRIHSTGDYFSVRGMPGNRGVWLVDYGQFDDDTVVFSACGGAALYRRSALADTRRGPREFFDERLFMYCEDVDLGWRLQMRGWTCVFEPQAVVYHHLSATGGGTLASYYVARNVWLVLSRSVPKGVLSPWRWRIIAYHLGRFLRSLHHIREPAARASIRGTMSGIAMMARSHRPPRPSADEVRRLRALLSGQ